MSDYFTRIAERAIGIAEAIKPRVPYRFEHGAFVVPTMPPTEHDEERSAEIADVDAPPTRPAEDPPRDTQPGCTTTGTGAGASETTAGPDLGGPGRFPREFRSDPAGLAPEKKGGARAQSGDGRLECGT